MATTSRAAGTGTYRVGVTADYPEPRATYLADFGVDRLTQAGLDWEVMAPVDGVALTPAAVAGFDAVLAFGHLHVSREVARSAPRLKHVARHGAGYDGIDVAGLAAEGVVVTNTPLAVRRPLALSAATLVLALSHRLVENHRAAASGRWAERGLHRGAGVAGRTIGIVGLGSVGTDLAALLAPWGARLVTAQRAGVHARAAAAGVEVVPLDRLAAESDYVVLTAALTPESHHLVDRDFLAAMKPTAYLVNVGRGGLVDQAALTDALRDGRIAGAGLDVLDPEPPRPDEPLLAMDGVIVTPHALCWTDDFTTAVADDVVAALVDVAQGRRPAHPVDPTVFDHWRRGAVTAGSEPSGHSA